MKKILSSFYIPLTLGFLAILALLPIFSMDTSQIMTSDFISFYTGARMIKEGKGRLIYNIDEQKTAQRKIKEEAGVKPRLLNPLPFRNPSFFGLFFLPLAFFKITTGYRVFAVVNIVLLAIFLFFSKKTFKNIQDGHLLALTIPVFFLSVPVVLLAQNSFLLLIDLLVLYLFIQKRKYLPAGICAAFLSMKLGYLGIIPFIFFAVPKRKVFLKGFIPAIIFLVLATIAVSGPQVIIEYPRFLVATETADYYSRVNEMYSLSSVMAVIPLFSQSVIPRTIFLSLVYFLTLFVCWRRKYEGLGRLLAIGILFTLSLGGHVLVQDLILLILPAFIVLDNFKGQKLALIVLFLFLYFVSFAAINLSNAKLIGSVIFLMATFLLLDRRTVFT